MATLKNLFFWGISFQLMTKKSARSNIRGTWSWMGESKCINIWLVLTRTKYDWDEVLRHGLSVNPVFFAARPIVLELWPVWDASNVQYPLRTPWWSIQNIPCWLGILVSTIFYSTTRRRCFSTTRRRVDFLRTSLRGWSPYLFGVTSVRTGTQGIAGSRFRENDWITVTHFREYLIPTDDPDMAPKRMLDPTFEVPDKTNFIVFIVTKFIEIVWHFFLF